MWKRLACRVKSLYEDIRDKVVSEVTVRRTRTDLLGHEQYSADLEEQGVVFPRVEPPRHILYPLSTRLEALYDRTIALLAGTNAGLTYNRYRAISFLKADKKAKYQHADRISEQSGNDHASICWSSVSIVAFTRFDSHSIGSVNYRVMVDMLDAGHVYLAPNLGVTQYLLEGREEEIDREDR